MVWPNGEPDDGKWAEDPWVQATRTFLRAYAGAYCLISFALTRFHGTGIDYDIDGLAAGRGEEVRGAWITGARDGARAVLDMPEPLEYYPGPQPFYVLDMEIYTTSSGQERATVYCCGIDGWVVSAPLLPWEALDSNGQPTEDFHPEIAAYASLATPAEDRG